MKRLAFTTYTGLTTAGLALITAVLLTDWQESVASEVFWHILWQLQLPLVITAILVGAVLAVSAASLQVVLHNPLADPGIIGISSGASLVAAGLLIVQPIQLAQGALYLLPLGCFIGALLSTWMIYLVARRLRGAAMAVILAGIAISTVSGALMAWLYVLADAQALRNLTFWLMGSLYQTDWMILSVAGPVMLGSVVYQCWQSRQLNWLYGGETLAAAAGVTPEKLIKKTLLASALGVGAAVSVAGSIAFIGLLVPHFLRLVIGYNNRALLPACALCGAVVLLAVATLTEYLHLITLPVSMITATVGGPLLLLALYRGQWKVA
ncbi:FecCD family ABC transporter permease [Salinimonas sediminis]|uniref:FecCD family ABC transporter permease n=1 Tax=Salinimonas sediminis TaxID=2303538 RepID=UPI00159C5D90|nr:iron ABC transporter permease [Salinimonas sediminis]